MGKFVPALMATGGATAVSVGGVVLARNSGAGAEGATEATTIPRSPDSATTTTVHSPAPSPDTQDLKFESVSAFKTDMKKSDCVKDYFGENIPNATDMSGITTTSPAGGTFFQTPEDDSYKSCLLIQGKVNKYGSGDEEKWNGKFTWLWTFMRGDEGFINFNVAEPSDETSGDMKFESIFYLVEKKSGEDKWEVKHNKEVSSKVENANIGSYFPKASSELVSSVGGEYWGLFDNEDKLKKPCKTGDCGSDTPTPKFISKKLSFAKGETPSQKPSDWSNGTDWWTKLYPDIGWSLSSKTDSFTGKWTASSQ